MEANIMQDKDMKAIGGLVLGLFFLMVLVGAVFIAQPKLEESACTSTDSSYVYEGGSCLNETGGTAVTIAAVTQIGVASAAVVTVLGLLGLVVIIKIFKIVISTAKGFSGNN